MFDASFSRRRWPVAGSGLLEGQKLLKPWWVLVTHQFTCFFGNLLWTYLTTFKCRWYCVVVLFCYCLLFGRASISRNTSTFGSGFGSGIKLPRVMSKEEHLMFDIWEETSAPKHRSGCVLKDVMSSSSLTKRQQNDDAPTWQKMWLAICWYDLTFFLVSS